MITLHMQKETRHTEAWRYSQLLYAVINWNIHRPTFTKYFCNFLRRNNQQVHIQMHTYLLTYSTEQSASGEANLFSASQEIPRILWNPKVPYHIHKCPPPAPVLSQLDPVHTPTSHSLKINLNIILPSTPGSPKWSLSLGFPHQALYMPLLSPHTRYVPHPSHSSRFSNPNKIG